MIIFKSAREIEIMRKAGRITAMALAAVGAAVKPGVTTMELDEAARKTIVKAGGVPAFKGLYGFPGNICLSVNNEVVHGIPGRRRLKEGDVVSVDIGVLIEGYNGDAAITFPVGKIAPDVERLLKVTEESLHKGIEQAVTGNRLGKISHAVQTHAETAGFGVVRDYVGHGIGRRMHEDPQIPNFGPENAGPVLKSGMVVAIEPMINSGDWKVKTLSDNWTVVTLDGKPSAHFEHTVAITGDGPDILTKL
ncbi:MAG: type I methionyl aminopeptidase [Acidaminococcales bacterium]|jgi:methionyl aminopeptidase|nr:type I methionyl aminopeptidase [Acidaminococcales bacterium]